MLEIIRQLAGWDQKTPQQIYDELSEVVIVQDSTPHTFVSIGEKLGSEARSLINDTMFKISRGELPLPPTYQMIRADIDSARNNMSVATGLSLHLDERQALIDILGATGNWPVELIEGLKGLGRRMSTRWQTMGGSEDPPSVENIALVQLKAIREYQAINRLQAYKEALSAWNGSGEEPVL